MYADDYTGNIIDSLIQSDNPKVRNYVRQLTESTSHGNFVEEMFGIPERADVLTKTGNVGAAVAMWGNLRSAGAQTIGLAPKMV